MVYYLMSTEQWPIFSEEIKSQQIREQAQKGALNLAEIQHQNRHGNHMSSETVPNIV